ncbi:MAG TPA: Gfo/Idh/MocA family oxidoreductase [Firmicutes bacterium]|jgi:predicted dehydrogenase|nr:Gfo/Idh/MocA family oxidoreductase [Bacillota bacterium]
MSEKLRIGQIGCGGNGTGHLEAGRVSGVVEPVAVCDIIAERAESRKEKYGAKAAYLDYRELLQRDDVEAVVISVPNYIHHEIAIAALQAGKHVLCEKPMTIKADWAEEMVKTANASGLVFQVGMTSRFRPEAQWLKKYVAAGNLGEVYFGRARYVRRSGIPGWGSWFTRKEQSGGGPLIDIGVHVLDLTWYLMGCPKPVSVSGACFSALGHRKKGVGSWGRVDWDGYFDVEDFATALVRFENGAVISLEASWAAYTNENNAIDLLGTEKGAQLATDKVTLLTQEDDHNMDTVVTMPKRRNVNNFVRQMEAFAKAVKEGGPVMTTGDQGLQMVKILLGIYESARTQKEVFL